ncbi:MAG: alpha/beta hydrolase [Candidatus Thorarchaeota archaeon]
MNQTLVEFSSATITLHGVFSSTGSDLPIAAVILHPHPLYGGDMNNIVVTFLEHVLFEEGISSLRFDFRGTSLSPQSYAGISGAVMDAKSAIEFLKSQLGFKEVAIVGYSFGASTALRVALSEPPPFLVSLSASKELLSENRFEIHRLVDIRCPVLMFHGTSDQMIPFGDFTVLSKIMHLPDDCIIPLDGESHFYEKSLHVVDSTLRKFLRNISAIS